jgi:aryl-alcohol dehydrogenase-like predicted oxidoreductase
LAAVRTAPLAGTACGSPSLTDARCPSPIRITDDEAAATFEKALELGVRYFDVAPSYGAGLAEMRIGRALRRAADDVDAVRVPRSDVFVSTKVCRQLVPDRTVTPNTMNHNDSHGWAGGLNGFNSVLDNTYEGFMAQHNESLHRMGQPYVDGLLMHSQPLPGSEGWEQLTSGAKNTPLFAPFVHKMHLFAKTGSGQT